MTNSSSRRFGGKRILVAEDEYLVATVIVEALEMWGAEVVGPALTVERALALTSEPLHCAVLDVNLNGHRIYPVADALQARAVPFLFTTGYDARAIPATYAHAPRLEKPVKLAALDRALAAILQVGQAAEC
jgi:CheY-like chemotaxis protein